MKHSVVLTSELPSIAVELLSQQCDVTTYPSDGSPRAEDDLVEMFAEADGAITLLTDQISRRVLEANPNLRIVANCAVGTNNIDLEAARELAITVTNTPGVLTEATADLTLALILAVTRRVVEGDSMVRRNEFHGWLPLLMLGDGLQDKQLGIIGMGRIGAAVAKRAFAFGMRVSYFSRSQNEAVENGYGARRLELDELLSSSDIVSIHTPLTSETRKLIEARRLALMKSSGYLINTARGEIVDEGALAEALRGGRLRGAGLDVYEREPEIHADLLALRNVVLLPHVGSATQETRSEMARIAATNVLRVLANQPPLNPVA